MESNEAPSNLRDDIRLSPEEEERQFRQNVIEELRRLNHILERMLDRKSGGGI